MYNMTFNTYEDGDGGHLDPEIRRGPDSFEGPATFFYFSKIILRYSGIHTRFQLF